MFWCSQVLAQTLRTAQEHYEEVQAKVRHCVRLARGFDSTASRTGVEKAGEEAGAGR